MLLQSCPFLKLHLRELLELNSQLPPALLPVPNSSIRFNTRQQPVAAPDIAVVSSTALKKIFERFSELRAVAPQHHDQTVVCVFLKHVCEVARSGSCSHRTLVVFITVVVEPALLEALVHALTLYLSATMLSVTTTLFRYIQQLRGRTSLYSLLRSALREPSRRPFFTISISFRRPLLISQQLFHLCIVSLRIITWHELSEANENRCATIMQKRCLSSCQAYRKHSHTTPNPYYMTTTSCSQL